MKVSTTFENPKSESIVMMNSLFRNTNSNLYNAVSAPVAATFDALAERLQSVCDVMMMSSILKMCTRAA